jgi:hypothetical protein
LTRAFGLRWQAQRDTVFARANLVERGRTAYQKTSATYFRSGLFVFLLGAVFFLLGVFGVAISTGSEWNYFLLFMELPFASWRISHFVISEKDESKMRVVTPEHFQEFLPNS